MFSKKYGNTVYRTEKKERQCTFSKIFPGKPLSKTKKRDIVW
jgi:hypothetical protein